MPRLKTALFTFNATLRSAVVAIACLLLPAIAPAGDFASRMLDPVTTYTNGMPLASSTPLRSHNVYYLCDRERVGCCGGRYNLPCVNSLLYPNSCCAGRRGMQDAWEHQMGGGVAVNVEPSQFEEIGSLTTPGIGGGVEGRPPALPAPDPGILQRLLQ